jgi:hypothetical protein
MTASKHTRKSGQEGSEESELGGAIEILSVRDLEASVEAGGDTVKLRLTGSDNGGRTSAGVWCSPKRARELAAQLLQCAELAEQFDPEVSADD